MLSLQKVCWRWRLSEILSLDSLTTSHVQLTTAKLGGHKFTQSLASWGWEGYLSQSQRDSNKVRFNNSSYANDLEMGCACISWLWGWPKKRPTDSCRSSSAVPERFFSKFRACRSIFGNVQRQIARTVVNVFHGGCLAFGPTTRNYSRQLK